MATVRITGNCRNPNSEEWVGAPVVNAAGKIDRSLPLPEEAYQAIERGIKQGGKEGVVYLQDHSHLNWFLDSPWGGAPATTPPATAGTPAAVPAAAKQLPSDVPGPFRNVLVVTDLSTTDLPALNRAISLVAPGQGEVTLIDVLEKREPHLQADTTDRDPLLEAQGSFHLAYLLRHLEERGIAGRIMVLTGQPAQEIANYARRISADLIVFAFPRHDAGTRNVEAARWALCSRIELAPCPVLIVK